MGAEIVATRETLLDTCCILNLCAVGDPQIVLPKLPFDFYVSASVEREEISIRPDPDAGRQERRKIDLEPCFSNGLLKRCQPETVAERNLYVQLAIEVDDGEA